MRVRVRVRVSVRVRVRVRVRARVRARVHVCYRTNVGIQRFVSAKPNIKAKYRGEVQNLKGGAIFVFI